MSRLKKITFTGIDKYTKVEDLKKISSEFPLVEFGFLTSTNWKKQGNRYPNPKEMQRLYDKNISYSLHLCGRLARLAVLNQYSELKQIINQNILNYFSRMQINLGKAKSKEKYKTDYPGKNMKQIIIQTHSIKNLDIYNHLVSNTKIDFAPLFDPSGGNGHEIKLTTESFICDALYIGIAGGITPHNCQNIVERILDLDSQERPFWIDMETGVRDENDRFSTEMCYSVCNQLKQFM